MNPTLRRLVACATLWLPLALLAAGACRAAEPRTLGPFGPFGVVRAVGDPQAAHAAILLSGPGGWDADAARAADLLAGLDALVIGVDTRAYLAAAAAEPGCPNCSYELETLNKAVQKALGRERLSPPALVGLGPGAGATLVYVNLVQAPPDTFRGGVSVDFRPEIALSNPFCMGKGLTWVLRDHLRTVQYHPVRTFPLHWTVLQSADFAAFPPALAAEYAAGMPATRVQALPRAAASPHGRPWARALRRAFLELAAGETAARGNAPAADLSDLPLVEIRADGPATDTLAVFLSGDGGWAGLDQDMAAVLAAAGVDVVGVNSMRYFWTRRDPAELGRDLARILDRYARLWNKSRFVLIGYSLGGSAMPFMAARLPAPLLDRVRLVALLSPEQATDLEFQVGDWVGGQAPHGLPVRPEVARLPGDRVLCLSGEEEEHSLCPDLTPAEARVERLPGSHHFDGDYAGLAVRVLEAAGLAVVKPHE